MENTKENKKTFEEESKGKHFCLMYQYDDNSKYETDYVFKKYKKAFSNFGDKLVLRIGIFELLKYETDKQYEDLLKQLNIEYFQERFDESFELFKYDKEFKIVNIKGIDGKFVVFFSDI